MREIHDFERENISMSFPKTPDPLPLTRPTEFLEQNGKGHVPDDPDPEPSLSYSSSNKMKRYKKKKSKKYRKYDSSDPSSSDEYDYSNDSDYRHKKRKRKSDRKNNPIKLCARLTAKFLTTAYKSKIIRLKMDEDLLQHRIYFLTFLESLEIIFSQYTETYEVLLDYPKIGGNDIEDYAKKGH